MKTGQVGCYWARLGRGVLESKVFRQLGRVALQRHFLTLVSYFFSFRGLYSQYLWDKKHKNTDASHVPSSVFAVDLSHL